MLVTLSQDAKRVWCALYMEFEVKAVPLRVPRIQGRILRSCHRK